MAAGTKRRPTAELGAVGAGFNSSPLLQWLASLDEPASPAPPRHIAERLGQWLDWTDAIALSAALGAPAASAVAGTLPPRVHSLHSACRQARIDLVQAIRQDVNTFPDLRAGSASGSAEAVADFAPYRSHCRRLQRKMEARLGPLRAEVRAALVAGSPALAQLAALDAVMEHALAERAQHLLSTMTALLEHQFLRLPPPRQAAFGTQIQEALLAELDMRLQPIEGLLDALGPAPDTTP